MKVCEPQELEEENTPGRGERNDRTHQNRRSTTAQACYRAAQLREFTAEQRRCVPPPLVSCSGHGGLERIEASVAHRRFAFLRIELHRRVGLGGEDKIGHGYAAAVDKNLDRTLVDKNIEVISLALAESQRRPCAEGEVVDVVDGIGLAEGLALHAPVDLLVVGRFDVVRHSARTKVHETASGAVHDQAILPSIDIDIHLFAFGIVEGESALGTLAGSEVEFEFEGVFRRSQCVAELVLFRHGEGAELNGRFAQGTYFARHVGSHIIIAVSAVETEFARQAVGASVLPNGGDVGILPIADPRHGEDAIAGVGKRDGSVVIFAIVEPFHPIGRGVALELLAIEVADEVFRCTAAEQTAGVDVDEHDILLFAVEGEREEVGALKLIGLRAVAAAEGADIFPLFEIGRAIEAHFFVGRYDHVPRPGGCVPKDFGIAEILQAVEGEEDGIAGIFGERAPVVCAVGQALQLPVLVARRGVERNQRIFAKTGAVVEVDHRTAGINMAEGVAGDGRFELVPVQEIGAHGVPPVHVAPFRTVGVVLIVKMVFTVFVDEAVRVVHPAVSRRVVIERTIVVGVFRVPLVGEFEVAKCAGMGRDFGEPHHGFFALGQAKGHIVVGGELCQAHLHPRVGGTAGLEAHFGFAALFFDGNEEVFGWIGDRDDHGICFLRNIDVLRERGCGKGTGQQ